MTIETSQFKGTPGPWEPSEPLDGVLGPNDLDVMSEAGDYVAIAVLNGDTAVRDANARLIASAPELLASLQVLVRGQREGWWGEGSGEMEEGELQQAEAAIAKALGEQLPS